METRKEDYQEKLDLIRGRFDIEDYTEVQKDKPLDAMDVEEGVRAIPKDAGKEIKGTSIYYIVLNINGGQKTITFDYTAPPVKLGDQLVLNGGDNDGVVTVESYKDSRTIYIYEELKTENPSLTRVTFKE